MDTLTLTLKLVGFDITIAAHSEVINIAFAEWVYKNLFPSKAFSKNSNVFPIARTSEDSG